MPEPTNKPHFPAGAAPLRAAARLCEAVDCGALVKALLNRAEGTAFDLSQACDCCSTFAVAFATFSREACHTLLWVTDIGRRLCDDWTTRLAAAFDLVTLPWLRFRCASANGIAQTATSKSR